MPLQFSRSIRLLTLQLPRLVFDPLEIVQYIATKYLQLIDKDAIGNPDIVIYNSIVPFRTQMHSDLLI